ncbi:MAG: CRISPR-associated endonuclease Cas2 [Patescibacteria group bacterium]|nr:CRISPR-associated endonuclease Cas2 [Patescibacteria group bacterium]
MQEKEWDGYWRLVIFDIAEKKSNLRKQLRNKLKELGFGMWQKSIYISPFNFEDDVAEFLEEEKLLGMAYVLTAKHRLLGDAKRLANEVWNLDELNKSYSSLVDRINQSENLEPAKKLKAVKKICYNYTVLLAIDPCLPKELLPFGWQEWEVRKLIKRIMA